MGIGEQPVVPDVGTQTIPEVSKQHVDANTHEVNTRHVQEDRIGWSEAVEGEQGANSNDQGDGSFTLDEDMEVSPSIPLAEFWQPNNEMGHAGYEYTSDLIVLWHRPRVEESGRIMNCTMLESPTMHDMDQHLCLLTFKPAPC